MNHRLSPEKRALILSLLSEGTPINGVCRILHCGNRAVMRVIRESGAALNAYMKETFTLLPCKRLEIDEAWSYVGIHGQRMTKEEQGRGDFWLWAGLDADTKLIICHSVERRDWFSGEVFIEELASRISGPVQITTDEAAVYLPRIRAFFDKHEGMSYATEKKHFDEAFNPADFPTVRKNGVPKICRSERKSKLGNPNLRTSTSSHIERLFLSVRQENTRYTRMTLGYSKKLSMHRYSTALQVGLYNFCRKHSSLGKTPAQAANLELHRWSAEDVIALTDRYMRAREDAKFERAFARSQN